MSPDLTSRSYLALLFDEPKEYASAIAALSQVLRDDPQNVHALNNRAIAYLEIGLQSEAEADFDEATRVTVHDHIPFVNRGLLRERSGDLERAVADYTRAIEIAPASSGPWTLRARARAELGFAREALADYDQAIALGNLGAAEGRKRLMRLEER
jgi:tetratricopeptide (TPR) repeat protein